MPTLQLEKIEKIVRNAGALALKLNATITREEKTGPGDIVTEADRAVEKYLKDEIGKLYPSDSFWGEETGATDRHASRIWIIDPIDGTADYANRIPTWCVSVALYDNYEQQLCIVYVPRLDNFYCMHEGQSYLNGKAIKIPPARPFTVGYFYAINASSLTKYDLKLDMRFCNAPTAHSPCLCADGSVVGAYSQPGNIWDVAAGVPIAQGAGATVEYLSGKKFSMRDLFDSGTMPEGILVGDRAFIDYARTRIIPK